MHYKSLRIITVLLLAAILAGCNKNPVADDETANKEEFCTHIVNGESIDKALRIANQFLSGLPADMESERQLSELTAWLRSCDCVVDAAIKEKSGGETVPPTSEIIIAIEEGGKTKKLVMDVSLERPARVVGCRDYAQISRLNGKWKVTDLSIEGEMTDIASPPEYAVYPDFLIVFPDATKGIANGNTFLGKYEVDFEIKENQQIRFFNASHYVENELMIRLKEGIDAIEFAASHQGITPKELLAASWNTWLFETDGTERLTMVINRLSQDDNVIHVQRNHIVYHRTEHDPLVNILLSVKFNISGDELIFMDSQNNPTIIFNRFK